MRSSDLARELVAYEGWANRRILLAAAALDATAAAPGASWGSIDGSLRHVLGAQATWLARWTREPELDIEAADHGALEARFGEVQAAVERFAKPLTDDDWFAEIEFTDSRGKPHRDVLAVLLAHMINHGTYHRGEAALLLTEAGHSPGDLDLVIYRRLVDPTR